MIKLIILDVDGIMTDGRKFYDKEGNVVLKTFCDKDWTAIKRFKALDIPVIFITGDPYNEKILKNRNLPCIVNRGKGFHSDKSNYLNEILSKYNVDSSTVAFLGDDLFDLNLMKLVGYSFCPIDAPDIVKIHATNLSGKGGENLIKEMFDLLEKNSLIPKVKFDDILEKIYELDIKESF